MSNGTFLIGSLSFVVVEIWISLWKENKKLSYSPLGEWYKQTHPYEKWAAVCCSCNSFKWRCILVFVVIIIAFAWFRKQIPKKCHDYLTIRNFITVLPYACTFLNTFDLIHAVFFLVFLLFCLSYMSAAIGKLHLNWLNFIS